MEILKKVAPRLDKRLQDMQSHVLSQLEGKLKTASYVIEQFKPEKFPRIKGTKVKQGEWDHDGGNPETSTTAFSQMKPLTKSRFSMKKETPLGIVDEIEKWPARYDPSWISIMQMAVGGIDEGLQKTQEESVSEKVPIIVAAKGLRDAARANQDSEDYVFDPAKNIRRQPVTTIWNVERLLGRGGFGEVRLERNKQDGRARAVKRIAMMGTNLTNMECEKELKSLLEFSKPKVNPALSAPHFDARL
jgi:hypothetical protein